MIRDFVAIGVFLVGIVAGTFGICAGGAWLASQQLYWVIPFWMGLTFALLLLFVREFVERLMP